jgi:hypothetical protein
VDVGRGVGKQCIKVSVGKITLFCGLRLPFLDSADLQITQERGADIASGGRLKECQGGGGKRFSRNIFKNEKAGLIFLFG